MMETIYTIKEVDNGLILTYPEWNDESVSYQPQTKVFQFEECDSWTDRKNYLLKVSNFLYELIELLGVTYDKYGKFNLRPTLVPGHKLDAEQLDYNDYADQPAADFAELMHKEAKERWNEIMKEYGGD